MVVFLRVTAGPMLIGVSGVNCYKSFKLATGSVCVCRGGGGVTEGAEDEKAGLGAGTSTNHRLNQTCVDFWSKHCLPSVAGFIGQGVWHVASTLWVKV